MYAVVTEDMDALTFGTPVLFRHMTMAASRKVTIRKEKKNVYRYHVMKIQLSRGNIKGILEKKYK